jgi:hypothetical protein
MKNSGLGIWKLANEQYLMVLSIRKIEEEDLKCQV